MNTVKKITQILYWLPRVLALGFVVFLSLFSLDAFSNFQGWSSVLGFLIHLLPSLVLLALIIWFWKKDLANGILFLLLGCSYICLVGLDRPFSWYLAISGPAFLVGILFLINWWHDRRRKNILS